MPPSMPVTPETGVQLPAGEGAIKHSELLDTISFTINLIQSNCEAKQLMPEVKKLR